MFLTMGVGLYTSRLVLDALGVVDFGIYGLVGGIVMLFSFINTAMASASQRYLSFDIGKNDEVQLRKTFNATVNIHFFIAIVVIVLSETIGLWFLNYKLNIPIERLNAANWIYQFSIISFVLNIIQVPYTALLFAREHMNIYAYVSIVETFLKLLIVFLIINFAYDKLIFFAFLTLMVAFITQTIYRLYCKVKFKESKYTFYFDKKYYTELISFTSWSVLGNIAVISTNYGFNILVNLFFGLVTNSALLITSQLTGALNQFVGNFQIAFNPQIIKLYANNNLERLHIFIFKTCKFSFYLFLIVSLPIILNSSYFLNLWLVNVPENTNIFVILFLISLSIESLSGPIWMTMQATGKIKKYQIIISMLFFLNIIISYLGFLIGFEVVFALIIRVCISIILLLVRIYLISSLIKLKILNFVNEVFFPIIKVILIFILYKIIIIFNFLDKLNVIVSSILDSLLLLVAIFIVGLSNYERGYIIKTLKFKLRLH